MNELLTLSVDGKAEHIANHENKGTSNFTVVITEEKTGKVLGLYNLNRKEELKHGKKGSRRKVIFPFFESSKHKSKYGSK